MGGSDPAHGPVTASASAAEDTRATTDSANRRTEKRINAILQDR